MPDQQPRLRNNAAPWSSFDADAYLKTNYATVFPEDAEIIRFASKFLTEAWRDRPRSERAVDVGAGPNLYPALLMLPWTEHIAFTEYAQSNIDWLVGNLGDGPGDWDWQPFWDLMAGEPGYGDVGQPRRRLAECHDIMQLSIFELPPREWDLGSMFFVADGISSDEAEFDAAVRSFLGSLMPGSPLIMAFMEGSSGYEVNGVGFPAVKINIESLASHLRALPVTGTSVLRTNNSVRPLRPGYDAMILVTGYVTDR